MNANARRSLRLGLVTAVLAFSAAGTYAAVRSGQSDEGPPLPPAKQAIVDRIEARRKALPHRPEKKLKANPNPPAAIPEPAPLTGILQLNQTPFAPGQFMIENRWQALNGRVLVQVFAGSLAGDESQGVVILRRIFWQDGREISSHEHRTKNRVGALRIVEAHGHRLKLKAKNQDEFDFDADRDEFVS